MIKKDLLWKGIIESLFDHFLYFFFEDFVEEVDFTKPFEFLDKDLAKIFPESNQGNRRADMLVKVSLKDGHYNG